MNIYDIVIVKVGSHKEMYLAPMMSHINEGDEVQVTKNGNVYPVVCVMRSFLESDPTFQALSYAFGTEGKLKKIYALTTTKEVVWDE